MGFESADLAIMSPQGNTLYGGHRGADALPYFQNHIIQSDLERSRPGSGQRCVDQSGQDSRCLAGMSGTQHDPVERHGAVRVPGRFRIPDQFRCQVLAKIYSKPFNRLFGKADGFEASGMSLPVDVDGPLEADDRIHLEAQFLKPAMRCVRIRRPEHKRFGTHWRIGDFLAGRRLPCRPAKQFDVSAIERYQTIHRAKVVHG